MIHIGYLVMLLASCPSGGDAGPFSQRGYYITFMRMPTYDLNDWKRIVDGIKDDGGNTLLLWVAGSFRSRIFPITWAYNKDHENVRHVQHGKSTRDGTRPSPIGGR